jgi:TetR/AcrR family transcriptional regulator, lmrAB and yxaGH operons repressor
VAKPRSDSRDKIIASARVLFRRHGYHGTGLAQIIAHSGAPRGSVYFLFPGGKEQLAAEAVNAWAAELAELIRCTRAASTGTRSWVESMAEHFAAELERSGFTEGLPLTTITLDSVPGSKALTAACRAAYDSWLTALAEGLTEDEVPPEQAGEMAQLMLASLEGAAVLCRAYQSTDPLRRIVPYVLGLLPRPEATRGQVPAGPCKALGQVSTADRPGRL